MKINRCSWHGRFWFWIHDKPEDQDINPSVCEYVSYQVMMPVIMIAFCWMFPLVWLFDKIEVAFKGKGPSCPFGKVEFVAEKKEGGQ